MYRSFRTSISRAAAALGLGLAALAPSAAQAQTVNACGGENYFICFSITNWKIGTGVSGQGSNGLETNKLQFTLTNNTSTLYSPATLTEFLIGGTSSAFDAYRVSGITSNVAGATFSPVDQTSAPNTANGLKGFGFTATNFFGYDNDGNIAGVPTPGSATLTFTFTTALQAGDFQSTSGNGGNQTTSFLSSLQFAAMTQGNTYGGCGGSSKVVVNGAGTVLTTNTTANGCTGTPIITNNTVPEPASLALVGTGVLGLAGFARRRRATV